MDVNRLRVTSRDLELTPGDLAGPGGVASTKTQKGSARPWTFGSHWKSGVMVSSTMRQEPRIPDPDGSQGFHQKQCRNCEIMNHKYLQICSLNILKYP